MTQKDKQVLEDLTMACLTEILGQPFSDEVMAALSEDERKTVDSKAGDLFFKRIVEGMGGGEYRAAFEALLHDAAQALILEAATRHHALD